ncbi:MAG: hypothetical protein ABFR90_05585 [Planctomycetota bacterium]
MHTSLTIIILASIMIPAVGTSPLTPENYSVSEVIRVLGPDSFECRLSNYKPAPHVRFRVLLPGLDTQKTDERSKEQLADRLKSAKYIELRNVTFRSYFRVEADVWIDGHPYWRRPDLKIVPPEKDSEKQTTKQSAYQLLSAVPKRQPAEQNASTGNRSVTIRTLLETPVDCSMLRDDTPLSEALTILSESVEPRLPLVILWGDLQANAMIEKDTPIGVAGFRKLKLRQALNIVLHSAAGRGPKLALISGGGILTLRTQQTLPKGMKPQVYDTRDIMAMPSTAGFYNQGGGHNRGQNVDRRRPARTNRSGGFGGR